MNKYLQISPPFKISSPFLNVSDSTFSSKDVKALLLRIAESILSYNLFNQILLKNNKKYPSFICMRKFYSTIINIHYLICF